MENRELWLNSLSDDEVQNINPWDILTQPKATGYRCPEHNSSC